jgi:autotransporter-associated beta strand protein
VNHIYRLVFNRALGVVQVVSELASASQGGRSATAHGLRRNPLALACAGLLGMASVFAAMPASAGDVTSAGDIALSGDIVEPGNVSYISTGGSIFQSDPANDSLTVAGNALFGANGYIDMSGTGNDFQGLVSLQGNAATINDANALQLSISTITNGLTVTSHGALDLGDALVGSSLTAHSNGGAITGGPLVVNGSSTFDAGAGAITLTNADNDFTGVVTATGNGIAITDATSLTTATLTSTGSGNVTLSAGGSLSAGSIQTGGGNVTLAAAGNVDTSGISANGGDITLTSNGGALTANGALDGGIVGLTSSDGLTLNADVTASGTLALRSVNAGIAQTAGSLIVNGNTSATAAGAITLTNFGNDFLGAVDLSAGGLAQITDVNALTLGSVNTKGLVATSFGALDLGNGFIDGNLGATSNGGTISQNGALAVTGSSTIDAGIGDITLTNAGNDFTGALSLAGNNVRVVDANDLVVSTLSNGGDGDVSLISGGTLTLYGVNTTTGDLTLASNGGALTTAGNLTGGDVSLTGRDGLTLNNSIAAFGTLHLGSTDNAIQQTGGLLLVSGTSDIDAGTGDITLTGANDFGNTVNITGGQVQINDVNLLSLGQVSATDFTATASNIVLNQGITTSGDQTYNGAMSLSPISPGPIILGSTGGGDISFDSSINGVNALTVNTSGTTTFGGNVGDFAQLDSLVTDAGGSTVLNGNVTTNHAQTYNDAATLGADITLLSWQGGNIGFGSTLDGAHALTVNTTGTTIFGTIGGTTALASLTTDAGGGTVLNGNITTTGSQNYNDTVTLGEDATLASTGSGNIAFGSTVDGAHALTVNTGGNTNFGAAVGATTALASLTTDAGGSTTLGGDVRTTGAQTYGDAVTLGVDATLASTGGGDITFSQAVDGTHALTVNSGGNTRFLWTVGGTTALTSLTTDAGGNTLLAGNVTTTGAQTYNDQVVITGLNRILTSTGGGDIHFGSNVQGALGPLTVHTGGAVSFAGTVNLSGLNVIGGSGITQSGAFTITGTSSFNAGGNDITLTNAGNDFTGAVSLTGNNVQVTDQNDLTISTLANGSGGDVSLIAGGVLTLPGAIATTGDITLASNGGALTTAGSLSGNDVSLTGRDGVTLQNDITASGTLSLGSDGGSINQTGGTLLVAGNSDIDAGTGDILLSGVTNDFTGAVNLAGNNVQITDANTLTLGALATGNLTANSAGALNLGTGTIGGNLSATSNNGAIGQSGALTVTGTGNIDAGVGNITLTDAGNDFGGAVDLTGSNVSINDKDALSLGALSTGALTANSHGTLNLGTGTIGGNLSANSNNGAISQSGALTVTGTSNLDAGVGNITLTDAGNDFGGAVDLTGSNVSINDKNALSLGALATGNLTTTSTGALNLGTGTIGGNLSANSNNGAIGQSGALTVTGTGNIDAGTGAITLTNAGNDFAGTVDLTGGATQINDANALTLGLLNTGALTATSHGALNVGAGSIGGNLSATSNNGAISQSGALSVSGTSIFNAGTGSITLTNGSNDFQGTVGASGGNIAISDANTLALAAISGSDVTITAAGDITMSGDATATGTFDLTSNGGNITQIAGTLTAATLTGSSAGATTLDNINQIATLGDFSAGSFSLTNAIPLSITGMLDSSGDIHLDSGAITVTGAIDAGGTTTLGATTTLLFTGNGSLAGDLVNDTNVTFDQSIENLYAGSLSGSGALDKLGSGTLVLDGDSSAFAGTTDVQAGTLIVGGSAGNGATLGGDVSVSANATLGGHGEIGGDVSLASGAHLAPGNSIGTLTVDGDLVAAQGSELDFELGSPGADFATFGNGDSVVVGGDLTLDGATLNVVDAGGMGPGLYTLFSYGGVLTYSNGGLVFGSTPAGLTLSIQNLTGDKRINLLDTSGMTLNFWNGNGLASATQLGGGDGTWSNVSTNWTDANGSVSAAMQPQPGFAIFGGDAGTVTIDDGSGAVAATGLQFASDGYVLDGDTLTLVADGGATPTIRVGDGSAASAGMTATIDSVITGSDGLTKSDLGTLVLTADNTFSGTLGIDGGTLSVTREANLGEVGNALALDGGVLRITGTTFQSTTRDVSLGGNGGGFDIADAGNVFTLSQSLSGSGALAKSGTGTLVFTGDNTYTGGTIISAGTLRLGNGGTSGSIAGDVANNGSLAFDRSDAVTFAGAINGTGTLQQLGSGSTILTGANTYTGGTVINAGTLQIGNGGTSGSIAGDVTDNGTLAFDRSDALTFAGTISGTGSLQQIGSGTLVLDGDSSAFAGATSVQSGSLIVGGTAGNGAALGGDVDVASGAVLGGHGEIGGSVTNAGTLAPGASIGTLTIHGDYTQAATGTFEVEVTPDGQADLLAVDGSATLAGGTVVVAIDGDWKPRTDYTILTAAGGVNGSFDAASSNLVFLDAILGYGANAVTLSLQRNDVAFSSFAGTRNQRATAAAADTLDWGNAAHDALTLIDAAGAPQAFDALSGEVHATTRGALLDDSRHLRDAVDQHLQGVGDDAHAGGWIANWGHWARSDSDGNADALRADGLGFAIGADRGFGARARLGVVAGSSQITVRADARASVADVDSRHLGAYGRLDAGWLQLRAGAARSWQQVGSQRAVVFAGYDDTLQADYDARTTQAYLDGSHAFAIGRGSVAPFLNLAQVRVRSDAFNETGGDAALQVEAASDERTYATLGMRWSAAMGADDGLRLQGSVGWTHASGGSDDEVNRQRFLGGSDMFEIAGTPVAENAFSLDAGLRWQADPRVVIEASYIGRFASDARDQGARLMLNWAF